MTAPPVPEDPSDSSREFAGFAPSGLQGNEQKSAGLVLSPAEATREALLSAAICVEHARIAGPFDSRVTARYASQVVDNSRRLAGSAGLHLNLLAGHVMWLRSLPAGVGELR
jgi:hypothetical protein